jgi:hypothetical protein
MRSFQFFVICRVLKATEQRSYFFAQLHPNKSAHAIFANLFREPKEGSNAADNSFLIFFFPNIKCVVLEPQSSPPITV